ncbi:SLOG family protein [Streptomyces ardesiacus]|uniref:SLOG family protein n=1 Tax=Streptomyces ardesiacus TaxID=285564 RepID=UPI003649F040
MFTVIVTGSRDLRDWYRVFQELHSLMKENDELTVRHGGCPTGADSLAHLWVSSWWPGSGVHEEIFPADWETHKKKAGPIRNREMAQAGADLCLAFPLGESRGTWNCVNECKKAGIPVKVIE